MIFKSEDFYLTYAGTDRKKTLHTYEEAAEIANKKLNEWLDKSPTVYTSKILKDSKFEQLTWGTFDPQWDTHRAKLVCIEKIKP